MRALVAHRNTGMAHHPNHLAEFVGNNRISKSIFLAKYLDATHR
jgi:hypothetical protein